MKYFKLKIFKSYKEQILKNLALQLIKGLNMMVTLILRPQVNFTGPGKTH